MPKSDIPKSSHRIELCFYPEPEPPEDPTHPWCEIKANQYDGDGRQYLTSHCATIEELEDEVAKLKSALDEIVGSARARFRREEAKHPPEQVSAH
jgi:hypothetical protein